MKFKIKEIRMLQKMSQENLAEASHVSRATISGLENGKIVVTTTETLRKIAIALSVEVSDLIF